MPPLQPSSTANGNRGPSQNGGPSKKRSIVNYESDASDMDEDAQPPVKISNFGRNGLTSNGSTKSTPNGSAASSPVKKKKRKVIVGKGQDKDEGRRAKEAERLWETRRELPFYQGRKTILDEILANDTTIILGETGCGKSTQLPHLLRRNALSLDYYKRAPRIAITQPRRLPAIALASRVGAEMGVAVGEEVGYTVRFEDATSRDTGVRFLTEGVLMRELASASRENTSTDASEHGLNLLLQYDVVVIDEAHERTLNTDFLCGALKKIQRIRKELAGTQVNGKAGESSMSNGKGKAKGEIRELKIVVMSATLDPSKFVRFFETNRPALIVKGRMYEVTTQHLLEPVEDFIETAAKQVLQIHCSKEAEGDVLVFMPGSEEIETCAEILKRASKELPDSSDKLEILTLYASLAATAQAKIFSSRPENTRRVVIATNIAETSITISGVSYVVDTGFKKEKEYIYRSSGAIEHLKLKSVSKAAAWQRTGRAGRERTGYCYRLFTEKAFNQLHDFDAPEIQRCDLAAAVLQLIAMGQNPFEFEYIDDPGRESILAAFQTLFGLEAISGPTVITPLGRRMLHYPLDPSHARILLSSFTHGCSSEIIDILSIRATSTSVWIDKATERDSSAQARQKFLSREGDHMTGMNLFRAYMAIREDKSESPVRWAKDNYANLKTLQGALKVRDQLYELARREGVDPTSSCGGEMEKVAKCLLSGLYMNTAVIQSDGTYRQTAGSLSVKIHPSSVLMSKKVPAILYDELTITSAMYARNVSSFEQSWLADLPPFRQAAGKAQINGSK